MYNACRQFIELLLLLLSLYFDELKTTIFTLSIHGIEYLLNLLKKKSLNEPEYKTKRKRYFN